MELPVALITRGLTLGLLVIAFIGKTSSRAAFDVFADSIRVLSTPARRKSAAYAVVAAEVLCIAALVLPLPSAVQFAPASLLFAGMAVYVGSMHSRYSAFDCHCFGSRGKSWPPPVHATINALVAIACAGSMVGSAARSPGDVVFYTGSGVILGILLVALPGTLPTDTRG